MYACMYVCMYVYTYIHMCIDTAYTTCTKMHITHPYTAHPASLPSLHASSLSLGLQIAQSRYYLQTLDPKAGTICILGALGSESCQA